jgi:hypothetical protein
LVVDGFFASVPQATSTEIGGTNGIPAIVTSADASNPPYPTSQGTRGFYRGVAMAQSLPEACNSVTNFDGSSRQPINPGEARDLSANPAESPEGGHVIQTE